jgi:hypothetical protein
VRDGNNVSEGPAQALLVLPSAELVTAPCATLEVVAIAAGVFALVLSFLWLYMPSEGIWLFVGALAVMRRRLLDKGFDVVLARRPRRSSKRCLGGVTCG